MLTNHFSRISGIILALSLMISSCVSEEVEFKSIKDISVKSLSEGDLTVTAVAIFFNPNKAGLKISDSKIDVFVNGKVAGTMKPLEKVRVKSSSVFEVPVELKLRLKDAAKDGNLFNLLLKREIDLTMLGYVKVSKFFFPKKIPVNFNHKLKF